MLLLGRGWSSARGLVGAGTLSGGALLPAPGERSGLVAPLPRHLPRHRDRLDARPRRRTCCRWRWSARVLLGKAWLLVDVLFLLAVPLAALGAYRFLLRVTSSLPMSLWGAVAYGVLPVVTGRGAAGPARHGRRHPGAAVAGARRAVPRPRPQTTDRRRRAAWRTVAAGSPCWSRSCPSAWLARAGASAWSRWRRAARPRRPGARRGRRHPAAWPRLVLLLPWTVATWAHQGAASLAVRGRAAGAAADGAADRAGTSLLGRPGDGAPGWLAARRAAGRGRRAGPARHPRRPCCAPGPSWWSRSALTAVLAAGTFSTASSPTDQPLWLGFPLVLAQAAAITAAALAGTGIRRRLSGSSFGWRQPLGVLVVVAGRAGPRRLDAVVGLVRQRRSARPAARRPPSRRT